MQQETLVTGQHDLRPSSWQHHNSQQTLHRIQGRPLPKFLGSGRNSILIGDTTRAYQQTIYKWTAQFRQFYTCEMSDKTHTDRRTQGQQSNLRFALALNEPLRNNKSAFLNKVHCFPFVASRSHQAGGICHAIQHCILFQGDRDGENKTIFQLTVGKRNYFMGVSLGGSQSYFLLNFLHIL